MARKRSKIYQSPFVVLWKQFQFFYLILTKNIYAKHRLYSIQQNNNVDCVNMDVTEHI